MNLSAIPSLLLKDGSIGNGYTWGEAAITAVCGFAIVFFMLLLLIVIIKIFGAIMDSINGKNSGTPAAPTSSGAAAAAPTNVAKAAIVDDDEIIAVIAAAVSTLYEGTGIKPTIRNIRKSTEKGVRSNWANVGIFKNTRAF